MAGDDDIGHRQQAGENVVVDHLGREVAEEEVAFLLVDIEAQAARAAGMAVVLVSYGYNHGEPVAAAAPDAVIARIDELPALLLRH